MVSFTTIKPRNIDITGDYVVNSIAATGNISANTAIISGNITVGNVKTDSILYANGSPYSFTTLAAGSNTQIQFNDASNFAASSNFTFDKTTNTLSVTNIVSNGSGLSNISGANVTGVVANATFAITAGTANSVEGVNVSGQVANALVSGTVYTNAQPNITSVGTLTSLSTSGDLIVGGNLTVNGTLTSLNTEQVTIEDNVVVLNSNVTGTPVANGGIEVERGTSANVSVLWNETDDAWTLTNDGTNFHSVVRKYSETLSTSATSYTITHNLGTRDILVQIYEVGSPYAEVEADVEHTSTTAATLRFAAAPTAGAYRVVISG